MDSTGGSCMPMDIACSEIAKVRAVLREGTCRWEMKSTILGTISPSFSLSPLLCLPPNEVDESFLFRVSGLLAPSCYSPDGYDTGYVPLSGWRTFGSTAGGYLWARQI